MHISDGVLPTSMAVGSYAVSLALTAWSVRKTRGDDLPKVAVVTSSFFVASLIHVPLGPTSVHLLIPGLVGILLGSSAFVSVALGLLLQSLLFQFGGITAWGANSLMMGLPALTAGWLFALIKGKTLFRTVLAGAICGGLGVMLAGTVLAVLLISSGEDFLGVAKIALVAHLPVIAIEAAISAFTVSFLYKVKPELLRTAFPAAT
ncbi:cobalt transporter CbiM [Desulfoferrobacter suflitae]|uniref:cobalt transporter CbiM n=1 Tax=Desulfoferrobacter suflitae TaxID=2865782 RepID=UPI0021641326|nr:cobalt transporter CbiM [Desulfoferrobacter suflitae]MCK8601199.1 cobalt transporter CbiM [Desulfoferrobacter suflitae]